MPLSNGPTQQSHLSHALKSESAISTANSQKEALSAAINAVEHYMKALRLAPRLAIGRPSQHPRTAPPASRRKLTTREEIILLEGAKLNGFKFHPWERPPTAADFIEEDQPFLDKPDLELSGVQDDIFAGWKRPRELLQARNEIEQTTTATSPVMSVANTTDLVQDVLTDCSVVASLCAITSRSERGRGTDASPAIYPCDGNTGEPVLSPSGKYIFCFYFNGSFRRVIIDDRLPSSKTKRSLHVIDRNNPNFLWPALVEKAYLKVRGGYDFPGSNSGTDLWVLTGWIPEQVFLHREDATPEEIWTRMYQSFLRGDVQGLGLVSEHDYAILDMKEINGRGRFLLKNPWAGAEPTIQSNHLESGDDSQPSLAPGTFWMNSVQVWQNFENLYLNWNPRLFQCREDIHFNWDLSQGNGIPGCFLRNPQFAVHSESGGTVWLLLGKHFTTDQHHRLKSHDPDDGGLGFISIYIFQADGKRVTLNDGALHRGPYVDSPNTLMRLEMAPRTTLTAVVSEQSLPSSSQNFTLSAFSNAPIEISPSEHQYMCLTKAAGSWSVLTAGGNSDSARYSANPQFSLQVSETTDVSILLECKEVDLATHVKLFWSNGQRVSRVRNRDMIADSGDYRRGCALAEKKALDQGIYTIVCSTFAPDQLGSFTLWISSTVPCAVKQLSPENAGRRVTLSRVGVLLPGKDRMLAPLHVSRLTRLKLIARNRSSTIGSRAVAPSPVLMTVERGQGPYKETLAISEDGTHSDAASGVRVEDFDLGPTSESRQKVWIVIERIGGPGGQVEDQLEVEALAEERVEIGEWLVEDA
ncbi:hypothetical protein N7470_008081 [Penicillium chermesinum]|nr:hypothetical protein N7470_008081 [Penicillium chermesinum]